jgi:hypothetical protein
MLLTKCARHHDADQIHGSAAKKLTRCGGPKALSQNREIAIRGRILSLIDYLSGLQEK